jgi:PhoPQ-activated pathogenicity-related protein
VGCLVAWGAHAAAPAASEARSATVADPLKDYVLQKDDSFSWKQLEKRQMDGLTALRLECVSQTWRGNVWRHEMLVVRPAEARNSDIAFLFITGDGEVDKSFDLLRLLAVRAGAAAAVINKVPNQPLYDGRKEDALIAYTFEQYLKSGDRTWPLLFPMVKSAVRAMDVIQKVAEKEFDKKIERFVVGGASKRGWTTWLTAATDARVQAMAPMVIDMLNMKAQTDWAAKMYGRQSEQIQDYTQYNFDARMDEPRMVELRNWVDPYSYRARYTMPKLLLLGTNDPYWVVDSLRHYWSDLPEPKLIFQTPNAGHDLAGGREARPTLAAFYQMVADRQPLPAMTWQFQTNSGPGVVVDVAVTHPAKAFRLWTANSPDRDFRNDQWSSVTLSSNLASHVVATVAPPSEGYRAYLVEAEITASTGHNFKLSTEARVLPDGPPSSPPKTSDGTAK